MLPQKSSFLLKFSLPLSCVISLLTVYLLSNNQIITAVIFFGQGHFLLAYLYANKFGKIKSVFLIKFFSLVSILGSICFYVSSNVDLFSIIIFFTSVVFTFHYYNDEFKIKGLEKVKNKIIMTLSVVFSFMSVFLIKIFDTSFSVSILLFIFSIILFAFYIYQDKEKIFQKNRTFLFFSIINITLPFFLIFKKNISAAQILGFIILFHYLRWYLYYFIKLEGEELNFYKDAVVWSNILVLFTFIEYVMAPKLGILYMFYSPLFFYAWSVVHIILFIRKEDYTITV
jgi:hypothetical protein